MPIEIVRNVIASGYGKNSFKSVHADGDALVWL
jgi:hypothetical protein